MMLPWWAMLAIQILNLILSNGTVAAMAYAQSPDPQSGVTAAIIAGGGSLINHLRANPLGIPELKHRLDTQ